MTQYTVLENYFSHCNISSYEGSLSALSLQISRATNTIIDELGLLFYLYQNTMLQDYYIEITITHGCTSIKLINEG